MTTDLNNWARLRCVIRPYQHFDHFSWSPDGKLIATGVGTGVVIWDAQTSIARRNIALNVSRILAVAWSPSGRWLAADGSKQVIIVDPGTGEAVHRLVVNVEGGPAVYLGMSWSPDGRYLAHCSAQGLLIWSTSTWEKVHFLPDIGLHGVAWSPDSKHVSYIRRDRFGLYDMRKRQSDMHVDLSRDYPHSVTWLPSAVAGEERILVAGTGRVIYVYSPRGRTVLAKLEYHHATVVSMSASADGQIFASHSADGKVNLWHAEELQFLSQLNAHLHFLPQRETLAFNPSAPATLAVLSDGGAAIEIWDFDLKALLDRAREPTSVHYTTARIALVGDSGAGKTGLGYRLARGVFREHASTHGQQFWVVDELGATRADGTQCEAVLWDLAGQPDYRLVHALFLDDIDLALVLFDPADRQEPLKGVRYWLKQLGRRQGRPCRTILVAARADRGGSTLTKDELADFCRVHEIRGHVTTSALHGQGIAELMATIRSVIDWDGMAATITTVTFKRIKEFVLALKADATRTEVLVTPAALRARLEAKDLRWRFSDAELQTAVGHLATHGYVTVLRGSRGEITYLLAPDLLANLASSIVLEARRNPKGLGALDEERLLQGNYELPELAALQPHERDGLLDAAVSRFLERNLCFRETLGAQHLLVFPALINQKRPQSEDAATVDEVSYHVSGAVENVYSALVVLLGYTNTFARTHHWQNLAQYETAAGGVCGFRLADERDGSLELVLYSAPGTPESARMHFQGLFEGFLAARDISVVRYPAVRCSEASCGYLQPRAEVIRRIRGGKGFIICVECGKKLPLAREATPVGVSVGEREQVRREQARSRRRTTFETALVRVKGALRDRGTVAAPSCFLSYAWDDEGHRQWAHTVAKDLRNAGVDLVLDEWENAAIGGSVARFIARIAQSDFVAVVGTPLYRSKYENRGTGAGTIVAAEVDLIENRLIGTEAEKATVLPMLLAGDERTALPPLMRSRVRADFRDEGAYFAVLLDLVLTLYRFDFADPAVADLRETLRADVRETMPN